VLSEARALRLQAEELCRSRQGNVEALEQQMADLRRVEILKSQLPTKRTVYELTIVLTFENLAAV
jgi:Tfp pilus assembly protein PilO